MSGKAGPQLLDTFSVERQPVGVGVITRANEGLRDHSSWMKVIGMLEPDVSQRRKILAEFDDPGNLGQHKRAEFSQAVSLTVKEFHGLGVEMNQLYASSGIFLDDELSRIPNSEHSRMVDEKRSVEKYCITTFPGSRLPHAWLNSRKPGTRISTVDLAGHGCFCLLTGPGGQAWKDAAAAVSKNLDTPINYYSIGWKQDYEDVYFDWAKRRQVNEDGCILVRPDRFVAWRSKSMVPNCAERLGSVLKSVLSL